MSLRHLWEQWKIQEQFFFLWLSGWVNMKFLTFDSVLTCSHVFITLWPTCIVAELSHGAHLSSGWGSPCHRGFTCLQSLAVCRGTCWLHLDVLCEFSLSLSSSLVSECRYGSSKTLALQSVLYLVHNLLVFEKLSYTLDLSFLNLL